MPEKLPTEVTPNSKIEVLDPGVTESLNPFHHADRVVLVDGEEVGRMGTRRGRAQLWIGFRRYELRSPGDVTLAEFFGDFFRHFSGRRERMRWHSAGGKRIDMGRDADSWQRPTGWFELDSCQYTVAARYERRFLTTDLNAQWLCDNQLIARLDSDPHDHRSYEISAVQPIRIDPLLLAAHLTFWVLPGRGGGGGGAGGAGGGGDGGGC